MVAVEQAQAMPELPVLPTLAVAVEGAPAREAGEVVEDDGEAYLKIVGFLEGLKVI